MNFIFCKLKKARTYAVKWTDKRTKTVHDALLGAELMKTFTWETPFVVRIAELRKKETDWIAYTWYLRSLTYGIFSCGNLPIALFGIYHFHYHGGELSTPNFFLLMALCRSWWWSAGLGAMLATEMYSGVLVSIKRIEEFLQLPVRDKESKVMDGKPMVSLRKASFRWKAEQKEFLLKDMTFHVENPGLTIIAGPIGSGKSALIK